ncbi:23313_t:CDS:1, partial [Cetraspora pellucida]
MGERNEKDSKTSKTYPESHDQEPKGEKKAIVEVPAYHFQLLKVLLLTPEITILVLNDGYKKKKKQ